MKKLKLTIGMAVFDDFDGLWFTLQAIRLYTPKEILQQLELVVVNNNPKSQQGLMTKHFVESWISHGVGSVQHIEMESPQGTAPPRNKVFEVAKADYVVVIDPHIMINAGAIERLIAFYEADPLTENLYTGPLWMDTLESVQTHFNDEWRNGMLGTWGQAWRCKCGPNGAQFCTIQKPGDDPKLPKVAYVAIDLGMIPLTSCGKCNQPFPDITYPSHSQKLTSLGYYRMGINDDDPLFEIPGNGLGLFTCRKDAWLGFNPHFRSFGGEEIYIHNKYKQHQLGTYCLPFLKWVHKFRPTNVKPPYPIDTYSRVRNYVIGFQELGMDIKPIYQHFVTEKKWLTENQWNWLLSNPIENHNLSIIENPCPSGDCGDNIKAATLDDLFNILSVKPRDIDAHMPKLREFASLCEHITEFSPKRESLVALAAGSTSGTIVSYNAEASSSVAAMVNKFHPNVDLSIKSTNEVDVIDETDLLFIDSKHTASRLAKELNAYHTRVRRFIILHYTQKHQERGEDNGPGLLTALRPFLRTNPQWSVIYHSELQNGLTVLSCDKRDKPELPPVTTVAGNFVKAIGKFVKSKGEQVDKETYENRLSICSLCPKRNGDRCSICGCYLEPKAALTSQDCPIAKWSTSNVAENRGVMPNI